MKYFALMNPGISQVRASLKSACADAIRDITLGYRQTFDIFEMDNDIIRLVGTVRVTDGRFRISNGAYRRALNKDGSIRKTPEPKPFLK